jgi:hypothetical protein
MWTFCSSSKVASQSNTVLVASSNKTVGAHSHRLYGPTSGKALPDAYSKYPEVISAPNTPSRQIVAILRKVCALHGFPDQSSATMGRSLPHTSSGSSAMLTPSVTSCHHRTIRSQMVGPNALSTPSSAASSNLEGREMWIKSWVHSCWLTGRHPAPLFHNIIVQLSCSSDVSPGHHWISYSRPSNQRGMTLR